MAPFTHVSADRPTRFSDGSFGVLYAGDRFEVALAETVFHHGRFMAATNEPAGWTSHFRELVLTVDARLHDLRGKPIDPASYEETQAFGAKLRAAASDGVVYQSVRWPGGECVGLFYPDCARNPVQRRHLDYHWDGERVDLYRVLGLTDGPSNIFRIFDDGREAQPAPDGELRPAERGGAHGSILMQLSTESLARSASRFPIFSDASPWGRTKTRLTLTPSTPWPNGFATRGWRATRQSRARSTNCAATDPDVIETLAEGGAFIAVPLVIESGRPVKANISLDAGLLDAIDLAAKEAGLTRSSFLASAAREKIRGMSQGDPAYEAAPD